MNGFLEFPLRQFRCHEDEELKAILLSALKALGGRGPRPSCYLTSSLAEPVLVKADVVLALRVSQRATAKQVMFFVLSRSDH